MTVKFTIPQAQNNIKGADYITIKLPYEWGKVDSFMDQSSPLPTALITRTYYPTQNVSTIYVDKVTYSVDTITVWLRNKDTTTSSTRASLAASRTTSTAWSSTIYRPRTTSPRPTARRQISFWE